MVLIIIVIHFRYTWGIPVSSKAAGCIYAVLMEVDSFGDVSQVLCLLYDLVATSIFQRHFSIKFYMEEKSSGGHSSRVDSR